MINYYDDWSRPRHGLDRWRPIHRYSWRTMWKEKHISVNAGSNAFYNFTVIWGDRTHRGFSFYIYIYLFGMRVHWMKKL